jgi:hypothetical protein
MTDRHDHDGADEYDDESDDWQWQAQEPAQPRKRRARTLLPFGMAAVGLGTLAYAAVAILTAAPNSLGNTDTGTPPPRPVGFHPSATDPAQAAAQTAQTFLDAWASGDLDKASKLTDSPAAAFAAMRAYSGGLHLSKLTTTVEKVTAETVSYQVTATVNLPAAGMSQVLTGAWTYASELTAHESSGAWLVQWQPSVLAPNLTSDTHLATVAAPPGAGRVTDDASTDLSSYADPGLRTIAQRLAQRAPSGKGTPGLDVAVEDDTNTPVADAEPTVVAQPVTTGVLATTIDPKAERAAEDAVHMSARSAMVVIRPSTGEILAIANNDGFNDDALTARIAPGSTMKVVTAAALFDQGLSSSSAVSCPAAVTVTGVTFHNAGGESRTAGTAFIDDFAASCNNAFTQQYQKLSGGGLANAAQRYFGLGETWDLGLGDPAPYFSIPADAEDSELAAEAFGQGTLGASPLAMASVAATVDTGGFHQPYLVAGASKVAATPLPSSSARQLRAMMRAVVAYPDGTAHDVGFGPGVYAKTGTADHGAPGATPNAWMIAYDPAEDVAVGCVVLDGDFGAQAAGPEVKAVIDAL